MDQIPVAAPIPQALNVVPTGASQMVMAMMMVTTAPMITASHAVTRMTASSTSNKASGSSATRVLPKMVFSGLRCWVKTDAAETDMTDPMDNPPLCWRVLLQSPSARRMRDHAVFNSPYAIAISPVNRCLADRREAAGRAGGSRASGRQPGEREAAGRAGGSRASGRQPGEREAAGRAGGSRASGRQPGEREAAGRAGGSRASGRRPERAGGGTRIQTMTAPAASAAAGLRQRAALTVLTWPAFDPLPVEAIVTTRHGGVSAGSYSTLNLSFAVGDEAANVRENRRRAAAALGADPADFVFAAQVHGSRAEVVSTADRGRGTLAAGDAVGPTDALVTATPGIVLAILVADCVPIVLYDPAAHVLACVHAGWRGTVARTAHAALAAMCSLGTRPRDVIAGIGPSVAAGSYQVGEEVAAAARDAFGEDLAGAAPDGVGERVAGAARDGSGGQ